VEIVIHKKGYEQKVIPISEFVPGKTIEVLLKPLRFSRRGE